MSATVPATARLHDIYRMRDLSGRLLYIGVTNGGLRRFMEHAKDKTWWREVAQIDVEHVHCSRTAIEAVERDAIRDEKPLYNVVHNRGAELPPPVVAAAVAPAPVDMWNGSDCTFERLVEIEEPMGVTSKRWRKATTLPDRTFYRHLSTLLEAGCVINVGTDKAPRYTPADRHKPPPVVKLSDCLPLGVLKVGDDVRHPTFGMGVVIDIARGGKHQEEATIHFAIAGTKHVAVPWAPLEIVANYDPYNFLSPDGGQG